MMMLFASFVLERVPLMWSTVPDAFNEWVQNAGAVAAAGIAIVLIARASIRNPVELNVWDFTRHYPGLAQILKPCIIISFVGYGGIIAIWAATRLGIPGLKERFLPRDFPIQRYTIGDWVLTASGALALVVVLAPIAIDLATRISWGRIWAIARLSWKEAIRGRVIWVFGMIALIFLFADWFVPYKPEDQLRSYVRMVYWSITPLFLITAVLLGAFSIPNDVKNNSIHTIVTKPVEKFEIVLGRFFGYAGLLTVGLAVVSALSLIYLVRGVNEDAKVESYTARVPQYGYLRFAGTKDERRGDSVGREWGYRGYITGPTRQRRDAFRQFAIWDFLPLPSHVLEQRQDIVFEFAFDIFRLSKGEEDKGVHCTFTFVDVSKLATQDPSRQAQELEGRIDEAKKKRNEMDADLTRELQRLALAYQEKKAGKTESEQRQLDEELEEAQRQEKTKVDVKLIELFQVYQEVGKEVTDFHTQHFQVPPAVLKALVGENALRYDDDGAPLPALRVFVSVDVADQAQMVGVAPQDFYLLTAEKPFWQNFLKGVIGMWCTHMLVLGVAIACSTYLSSVISLLITMMIYILGLCHDYLREIAMGAVPGGGPFESAMRITTRMTPAAQLEHSPMTSILQTSDRFFGFWVGRILNAIPDIDRHDLHPYVANGFDIGWTDVLLLDNVLPTVFYLASWAVLAYYLMKYREIANPT
jgi:ABC-type transport system involved in multi-copper enzyme maturation permease subunit